MFDKGENDQTSSVLEKQPTVDGEVNHRSPEQRLTKLQVVSVEEVRQILDVRGEQTTVVVEGSRSADSGDSGSV